MEFIPQKYCLLGKTRASCGLQSYGVQQWVVLMGLISSVRWIASAIECRSCVGCRSQADWSAHEAAQPETAVALGGSICYRDYLLHRDPGNILANFCGTMSLPSGSRHHLIEGPTWANADFYGKWLRLEKLCAG